MQNRKQDRVQIEDGRVSCEENETGIRNQAATLSSHDLYLLRVNGSILTIATRTSRSYGNDGSVRTASTKYDL